MKPFLILQLRPETDASDGEFEAFLRKGSLSAALTHRIRLDQEDMPADLDLNRYSGVIVGGGPGCVSDPEDKKPPLEKHIEDMVMGLMPEITTRDFPFMGCCYGIGILGHHMGARVSKERYSEPVGPTTCTLTEEGRADPMLAGVADEFRALVGHKEAVQELPEDCVHLVASGPCPYQMIRYGRNVYATQFHPEADIQVFKDRIHIYKDYGYFPPQEADALIEALEREHIHMPELILRNFVAEYGR